MGYKSGWLAVSATVPRLDLLKHPEGYSGCVLGHFREAI